MNTTFRGETLGSGTEFYQAMARVDGEDSFETAVGEELSDDAGMPATPTRAAAEGRSVSRSGSGGDGDGRGGDNSGGNDSGNATAREILAMSGAIDELQRMSLATTLA